MDNRDFLRNLRDRAISAETGVTDGPLNLLSFLKNIGAVLDLFFTDSDEDYKALIKERGEDEASIDLETGAYVLMFRNGVVSAPLVR